MLFTINNLFGENNSRLFIVYPVIIKISAGNLNEGQEVVFDKIKKENKHFYSNIENAHLKGSSFLKIVFIAT